MDSYTLVPPSNVVMGVEMRLKGPCGQIYLALQRSNLLPRPIPICRPLPGHLACVHLYLHSASGVAQLENHSRHFEDFFPQANTFQEVSKGIKSSL